MIGQTKSRPRKSGDNGLVETKNGSPRRLIRKHMGFGYIDAGAIDGFYREHLNPYLNYHRPAPRPTPRSMPKGASAAATGATRRRWRPCWRRTTPPQYLREGLELDTLRRMAAALSDTDAAKRMQRAKGKLFEQLRPCG
ncbi:MAG: hypothetical protein ACYDC6_14775 [Acidobacteriaceae bacterium]